MARLRIHFALCLAALVAACSVPDFGHEGSGGNSGTKGGTGGSGSAGGNAGTGGRGGSGSGGVSGSGSAGGSDVGGNGAGGSDVGGDSGDAGSSATGGSGATGGTGGASGSGAEGGSSGSAGSGGVGAEGGSGGAGAEGGSGEGDCYDDTKNGSETDIDCGGACGQCDTGRGCLGGADCKSQVCSGSICQAARCGDGVVNSDTEDCDDGNAATGDGCSATCIRIVEIATGLEHACVRLSDGQVKCWGNNARGQLGYGDMSHRGDGPSEMGANLATVDLGSGRRAIAIRAGTWHTCALFEDGAVKCWGDNVYGQLGYGDTSRRGDGPGEMGENLAVVALGTGLTVRSLHAGGESTCVVFSNGRAKCWGLNDWGQLGRGNTAHAGDNPNEMGDALDLIDFGAPAEIVDLMMGYRHLCARNAAGSVKCWAKNDWGQAGVGDTVIRGRTSGYPVASAPAIDWGGGRYSEALYGTSLTQHTCVSLNDGALACWGYNSRGQLGLGHTDNRGDESGEMGANLGAINLGSGRFARWLALGGQFSCAGLDDDTLKCWGSNANGQLGYGDVNHRGDEANELGDNLPVVNLGTGRTAKQVSAGSKHTCALLDDDTVKCWGFNASGELGLGDSTERGSAANQMGDALPTLALP